jgi:hypothetical protein
MNTNHHSSPNRPLKLTLLLAAVLPASLHAQTTLSQLVQADTYVSSGQPNQNFGTMGAMEIAAPTAAQNRTEETLQRFDTSALEAAFNTEYGVGDWTVTSVSLKLFSNVSTAGTQAPNTSFNKIAAGGFELDLLSDNAWSETGINWNNISSVLPGTGGNTSASLGDFNWTADGSSSATWALGLNSSLIGDITSGGDVTIFGAPTAGSTVGYLFNQAGLNGADLIVTANAVPEPASMASTVVMMLSSFAGFRVLRRLKN